MYLLTSNNHLLGTYISQIYRSNYSNSHLTMNKNHLWKPLQEIDVIIMYIAKYFQQINYGRTLTHNCLLFTNVDWMENCLIDTLITHYYLSIVFYTFTITIYYRCHCLVLDLFTTLYCTFSGYYVSSFAKGLGPVRPLVDPNKKQFYLIVELKPVNNLLESRILLFYIGCCSV